MNKPFCLGLSIIELSKIFMYKFWYDYVKPQYCEKVKQMIFIKTLQKMLKLDLIIQIMN